MKLTIDTRDGSGIGIMSVKVESELASDNLDEILRYVAFCLVNLDRIPAEVKP